MERDGLSASERALVWTYVRRYQRSSPVLDAEELYCEGRAGLLAARRSWNPARGCPFERYAAYEVLSAISAAIRAVSMTTEWSTRHARHQRRACLLLERHGHAVTDENVAQVMGITVELYRSRQASIAPAEGVPLEDVEDYVPAPEAGPDVTVALARLKRGHPKLHRVVQDSVISALSNRVLTQRYHANPAQIAAWKRQGLALLRGYLEDGDGNVQRRQRHPVEHGEGPSDGGRHDTPHVRREPNVTQWNTAKAQATAGDTILLTSDVSGIPADSNLAANVILDLGGHSLTISESTAHRGIIPAGGIIVRNGTVGGCRYPLWNWYGGHDFVFQDLYIVGGVVTAIKLAAANTIEASGVLLERVDIVADGTIGDLTTVDLGPGVCRDVTLTDVRVVISNVPGNNNTIADGIAFEQAYGTTNLTRVYVSGAAGDGVDLKNYGDVNLTDVEVYGIKRNAIKVWGHPNTTATWLRCKATGCGYNSMDDAGTATFTDCYFESGNLPGSAMFNGPQDPNRLPPHFGAVTATFTDCIFHGIDLDECLTYDPNKPYLPWTDVNGIRHNGQDTSQLLRVATNVFPCTADYYNCWMWNGVKPDGTTPAHPNINTTYGGPDSGITCLVQNVNKANPVWPARYHNCTYGIREQQVALNPPNAPGTVPPTTGPTAGTVTVTGIQATQFTVTLSAGVPGSNPITALRFAVYASAADRTADANEVYDQPQTADVSAIVAMLTEDTPYYGRATWTDSAGRSATRDIDLTTSDNPDPPEPPVVYGPPTCQMATTGVGYVGYEYTHELWITSDYLTAHGTAMSDGIHIDLGGSGADVLATGAVTWSLTQENAARLTFTPTTVGVHHIFLTVEDGKGDVQPEADITVTALGGTVTAITRPKTARPMSGSVTGPATTITKVQEP